MAGLSTLPDDLTLLILLFVPNDSLVHLTTVSRAFHRSSTSQLYRYVYLWESPRLHIANNERCRIPGWSRYHHLSEPPSYATRIFDSSLFLRTITESEKLRLCIAGASITCRPDQEEAVLLLIHLMQPSTLCLHLKCTIGTFHRNRELLSTISSMEIKIPERSEINDQTGDLLHGVYKETIFSYFDLPNIKLLGLSGVRNWNLFTQDCAEKSSISSITSLSLTNTVPADAGLAKLLSWPRTLKSLRYELQLSVIAKNFFEIQISTGTPLWAREFSDALRSQEHNLEELLIYGDSHGDCTGFEPTETIDLHAFTNLKYVGLPFNFLYISQSDATFRCVSVSTTAITKILPLTLEMLQIEMPLDEYSCPSYFSTDPANDDVDLRPGELSTFVLEIVRSKATCFTNLRSIVFWQPVTWINAKIHTLEDVEGCGEIVEACKAANVHICWDEHYGPPSFS